MKDRQEKRMEADEESRTCLAMISNDEELRLTLARVEKFQQQIAELRGVETNPLNYRLSVDGSLAEIDRMNLEVRDYLSIHPSEVTEDQGAPANTQ